MNLGLYVHALKFTTCVKTPLTLNFQQKILTKINVLISKGALVLA